MKKADPTRLAPRNEKILMAMYHLGPEKTHTYEDIVVSAFEHFPDDFAMRGHPKYPDSSDVHKPLYKELKAAGYVLARNKRFRLTPSGVERSRELVDGGGRRAPESGARIDRDTATELKRLMKTQAAERYATGKFASVIDTDFNEFFQTSVRLGNRDFQGRLAQTKQMIAKGVAAGSREAQALERVRVALLEQFREMVATRGGEI